MRTIGLLGAIVTTMLLAGDRPAYAQRGGFGSESIMERLDEDGNGRIDRDEMEQSRMPIAQMAEQAGIDTSRGLDEDDVAEVFEQMQRAREQGGGFGGDRGGRGGIDRSRFDGGGFGPGGFGGGGFGQGGFGDGGDRGGRSGFDRGGRSGFDRGGRGGFDRGGRGDDRSRKEEEPKPRYTMDLQSEFLPGDTNGDGQIAMAEWLRWKSRAAMAEFFSLDRNADGILTPRELSKAASAMPVDLATLFPTADPAALQPASGSPAPQSTSVAQKPDTNQQSPASSAIPTTQVSTSSADAERLSAQAQGMFRILDRDRDGNITELEWRRSTRLRPKFEDVGADLTQPMSQDEFTRYYVAFSSADNS